MEFRWYLYVVLSGALVFIGVWVVADITISAGVSAIGLFRQFAESFWLGDTLRVLAIILMQPKQVFRASDHHLRQLLQHMRKKSF